MAEAQMEIVVAFLDKNQGIACNTALPWPYLKDDHEMYMKLITTTIDPDNKNACIMGRVTWEMWGEEEKCNPKLFNVVTSCTLQCEREPYLQKVLPSLDAAIEYLKTPPVSGQVERIFLLGGGHNYRACA